MSCWLCYCLCERRARNCGEQLFLQSTKQAEFMSRGLQLLTVCAERVVSYTNICPYSGSLNSFLTRNWSRCRSDSGVNSVDMGMMSLFLIMIALQTQKGKGSCKFRFNRTSRPIGWSCLFSSVFMRHRLAQGMWQHESQKPLSFRCLMDPLIERAGDKHTHLLSPAFATYSFPSR